MLRIVGTYSNVTIPSSHYVEIDSYSNLGVSMDYRCISMTLRGWTGLSKPLALAKGQNGDKFYVVSEEQTITSFGIEYYFYIP